MCMSPSSSCKTEEQKEDSAAAASNVRNSSNNIDINRRPPHPLAGASLWSQLLFHWPYPLLKVGLQRPLVDGDLADVVEADSSAYNRRKLDDIWSSEQERCRILNERHQTTKTKSAKNNHRPSLQRALFIDFLKSTWIVQPLMGLAAIAKIVQAVALGQLVESFERQEQQQQEEETTTNTNNDGYVWASVIVVCGLVILLEHHHAFLQTWRHGMRLRVACVAAIYSKSLRLGSIVDANNNNVNNSNNKNSDDTTSAVTSHNNSAAGNDMSYGRIMNLASNDVERFLLACLFVSYSWWALVQAVTISIVGVYLVGYAFLAGMTLLVLVFLPLQYYLSRRFALYRSGIAQWTDQRVTFVGQAVRGARVVKQSGYEARVQERVDALRNMEVGQLRRTNRLKAYNEALFFSTNVVISVFVLVVQVFWLDGTLRAGDVFSVFTLINILQLEMIKHVSLAVMGVSECCVSISRIQQFLECPELDLARAANDPPQESTLSVAPSVPTVDDADLLKTTDDTKAAIKLSDVSCYWNRVNSSAASTSSTDSESVVENILEHRPSLIPALENVNVAFEYGSVTAVIGTVGSGKSALLQALIGELPVTSGRMQQYVAPPSRTHDSCLDVNDTHPPRAVISSRSKPTIAYAAQDPWIMDGTVRENIIMGPSNSDDSKDNGEDEWYNRVVNACGLVPDFEQFRDGDQTIVGDRGVQCSGGQRARIGLARAVYRNADILIADDPLSAVDAKVGRQLFQEAILDLAVRQRGACVVLATHQHQYINECQCVLVASGRVECVGSYEACVQASNGKLTAHSSDFAVDTHLGEDHDVKNSAKAAGSMINSDSGDVANDIASSNSPVETSIENVGDKDNAEISQSGMVHNSTYVNYIRAMGGMRVAVGLLLLFVATQGSVMWTVITLSRWAERPVTDQNDFRVMYTVVGLSLVVITLALGRAFIMYHYTIKASQCLHDRMTSAVLRAKVEFFDTNPLGRVLNRFSADVGSNDDLLPSTLFDFFMIAFMILGAFVTTVATLPFTLLAFPPLLLYFYRVRRIFVTSSRELKRLEGLARSPIFAKLSESLGGIASIRANDAVGLFQQKFETVHDAHTRAFFAFMGSSRWVGFRMDTLVFLFLSLVCFLAVLFQTQGWFDVDAAILGLALSMLLQLAGLFQWCIRQSAEVVNQMVSVERVLDFGKLPPEADLNLETDAAIIKRGWPAKGAIEFENLSIRYRPSLPLALEGISCKIPAGSRVGIVGRTGSGKSTIVQTLFRLLEAEQGRILIDGVDISTLGLHALRTNISVIPQIPTLFSGCTVRENLDLFGLHSDQEIAEVLENCHLTSVVNDLSAGCNSLVAEGGSNFSVGQRQLLCLARAILSRNRILVLDEATASVDRRTDKLLHDALHHSFSDGTILAVAHRLDTIIEHDLILVLGRGKVIEFGSPGDLIQANGAFASMVRDTGETMSRELQQRASRVRR